MTLGFDELNIYEIENFKQEILNDLEENESPGKFELDFEFVEKIDLSSIQLILSLKKYCDTNNIDLTITNIKARQVKQSFKMYNLKTSLGVA